MSDLKKWNPFKFNRKGERKNVEQPNSMARREVYSDPFARMEQQMNQLMRGFFGDDDWFTPRMRTASSAPGWFGDFSPGNYSPSVDVTNEANFVVVSAELPGMQKEDVEVTFHDNVLLLKGEKKHERTEDEDGCFRTERYFGSWQRTVPLPADVDANGAEAKFDAGVLTVKFPKAELTHDEPKRIALG